MRIRNSNNKLSSLSEINITPLVDVMLVILIIFMITAPLLQQGLPVNLPQANSSSLKRTKQDIIVTVQENGKIFLGNDKKDLTFEELSANLNKVYSNKQRKDLFIKADSNLKYGTVVKVMSIAKNAGVARIGMLTQPELK